MSNYFSFIDLFSGIGGFKLALTNNGGKCLGFSETNRQAIEFYLKNFPEQQGRNLGDVTKIIELPKHDLLAAGVPCQSWSTAGKNLGFDDDRGKLWNDALYLLQKAQPAAFIFENVKGLADPRNRKALDYILHRIKEAGYFADYYLINSWHYSVPQSRIRIFIIGFKEPRFARKFKLPPPVAQQQSLGSLFGYAEFPSSISSFCNDYFFFNDLRNGSTTIHSWDLLPTSPRQKSLCDRLLKNRRKNKYGKRDGNPLSLQHFQELDSSITAAELAELVELEIFRAIPTETGEIRYDFKNARINLGLFGVDRIVLPSSNVFPTLTASDSPNYIALKDVSANNPSSYRQSFLKEIYFPQQYRLLNVKEACLLQGFPANFILPPFRSGWMRLIGNSVAVPVVEMLTRAILATGVFNKA